MLSNERDKQLFKLYYMYILLSLYITISIYLFICTTLISKYKNFKFIRAIKTIH